MSILELNLWQQAEQLKARTLKATTLVEQTLERIGATRPLNAYLFVNASAALDQALEQDRLLDQGIAPPLAGLPIALKDNLSLVGCPMTCGDRILQSYHPPYDATVVRLLRQAGAVFIGKTNLDAWAMGSSTEHSAFGPTLNPWDPTRSPGGSSGGSAVAVAAGLASAALGSDTGGSIRQPAAMTGVVGLKPTWGRVSRYGLTAYASSLEQPGPFGRCVRDVAMLLEVLAAPDIHDATCQSVPGGGYLENLEAGVAGLRVGLPREYLELDAAPPVREALQGAIEALKAAGAVVVDVSMPHTRFGIAAYYVLATAEAASNLSRYDGVRYGQRAAGSSLREVYVHSRTEGLGEEVQRRILLGTFVLSAGYYDAYYRKAQQARARIRADFAAAFADCDVLLTPTAPTPAFRLGEKAEPLELYLSDVYTVGANLAGVPAVSVPAGFSAEGLPVGVQLLAPWLEEARLLRAARALEAHRLATDGEAALRRPPLTGFDT